MIEASWTASSPESGRFNGVETRSAIGAMSDRFTALRVRGEGYLEVRRLEDYPVLSVGFRGPFAIVQVITSMESMALMDGDGSAAVPLVEVLVMDEPATFEGRAAVSVDHAWDVVVGFLEGRELCELGEWLEL